MDGVLVALSPVRKYTVVPTTGSSKVFTCNERMNEGHWTLQHSTPRHYCYERSDGLFTMAGKTLEARLEQMSVNDENEQPGNPVYPKLKPKVTS